MYLTQHNPSYLSDLSGGCACSSDMGMVTPANVATLGAMELGRTVMSYNRAIARTNAKIKVLKAQKSKARFSARKKVLQARIDQLNKKLAKLRAYRKLRQQKNNDEILAVDEDIILQQALAPANIDPMTADIQLDVYEQQLIEQGTGMDFTKILLYSALAGLALWGGSKVVKGKKKVRKNRKVIGKKRSNPKRKSVRRKRK